MTRKRLLGIGVVLTILAAALGTGLVIAQQGGGSDDSTEVRLNPLSPPPLFQFQSRLLDADGKPVNGLQVMTVRLYDSPTGGAPLYEENYPTEYVDKGLFNVTLGQYTPLDPALFDGTQLYLGVELFGDGEMAPRIPLRSVPYAERAYVADSAAWTGLTGVPMGLADGIDDDTLGVLTCVVAQVPKLGVAGQWECGEDTDTDTLGGLTCADDQVAKYNIGTGQWACGDDLSGGGGGDSWFLTGNPGTTPGTDFLGTTDDVAFQIAVNSKRALRLEPNILSPNLIGGHEANAVTPGAVGATIGGGGGSLDENRVTDNFGTVGGGEDNQARDGAGSTTDKRYATVSGGIANVASGLQSSVGGGSGNQAIGRGSAIPGGQSNNADGLRSAIDGGESNTASGNWATVAGGSVNTASGDYATVAGGENSAATGSYSFAAGRRAKANHDGAIVLADSTLADFASTAADQFNVRAAGGTRVFSDAGATVGVELVAGGTAWSVLSDAAFKENFSAVDAREILERLGEMPVGQWNLVTQDPSIQHIGPTAQDFYAAWTTATSSPRTPTAWPWRPSRGCTR